MRYTLSLLLTLLVATITTAQDTPEGPTYTLPEDAAFTIEDVTIERVVAMGKEDVKSFQIAGSLRVPTAERPEGGFPAVLFISGSGSQTRHGFQGNMDIGTWEVLDAISNAGFVSLCTDDRGIGDTPAGEEGLDAKEIGYDEIVADAQAVLDWLKTREEIDAERIFIIGHSEGGLTAPLLATRNEGIAGVITMGGMGRNLWDVTIDQVSAGMEGQPEAQREANMKAQKEFMTACKEDRDPDFTILGNKAAAQLQMAWKLKVEPIKAWWHDHFNLDVPAIHKAVTCPVFIAQGKSDFQVSAEKDARSILKNMAEGKCSDVTMRIYDDLDHLFKPCNGRESNGKMYLEDRRVSEDYINDVVAWLENHS